MSQMSYWFFITISCAVSSDIHHHWQKPHFSTGILYRLPFLVSVASVSQLQEQMFSNNWQTWILKILNSNQVLLTICTQPYASIMKKCLFLRIGKEGSKTLSFQLRSNSCGLSWSSVPPSQCGRPPMLALPAIRNCILSLKKITNTKTQMERGKRWVPLA